jgi:hypothetical protein
LLVVKIVIKTDVRSDGIKDAIATVTYRFPRAVVETRTGTGS